MKIILLNYPYLQDELREMGAEVACAGLQEDCGHVLAPQDYTIDNVLDRAGFRPDWIIFMDSLERFLPSGLETCGIPSAAYFIDSTINRFWQTPYAKLFDLVLTDQQPEAERLKKTSVNEQWFPLAADTDIYRPFKAPKKYDIAFVGNRNMGTRGKRENILKALEENFDFNIFDGDPYLSVFEVAQVYSQSRMVLNETLFPAVNLRLLEAMACNTVVLTEDTASGLDRLFQDGIHLLTYNPDNLLNKISSYLKREDELNNIAAASCELVRREHSLKRRAEQLMNMLAGNPGINRTPEWEKLSGAGEALLYYGVKWPDKDLSAFNRAESLLLKSLDIKIDRRTLLNLGKLCEFRGEHFEAQRFFRLAASDSDSDFHAPLFQGISLNKMGADAEAGECLSQAEQCVSGNVFNGIHRKPGSEDFHLFWGDVLRNSGEDLMPGLMQMEFPMQFWSALEHYFRAAQLNRANWEKVGDLLMDNHAPDQALQAYFAGGLKISFEKIEKAEYSAYATLNSADEKRKNILLSLCIIARDEEENLEKLLSSIQGIPDQIIVADTGSLDNTINIAGGYGAEVISITWEDDFSQARNLAQEKAAGRFILILDADERIDREDLESFKKRLRGKKKTVFKVKVSDERTKEVCYRYRVFPNSPAFKFSGKVMEKLPVDLNRFQIEEASFTISHTGYIEDSQFMLKCRRNLELIEKELKADIYDNYLNDSAARFHLYLGQELEAVEHLKKTAFSISAAQECPELYELTLMKLSQIFQQFDDYKTALKLLQILLKERPDSALGIFCLAMNYFKEQLYSECRNQLERFFNCELHTGEYPIAVNEIRREAHLTLGRCLEHQGHLNKAAEEYTAAMALGDEDGKIMRDIGRALYKAKDYTGAKHYLNEFLKNNPGNRSIIRMLEKVNLAADGKS
ncbi:glycosyltransferase [bacterium]|nr:glycosyltransferase [FCB group bacterium]MBL7190142.1 glycosyltransferase [bacterium]